MEQIVKSCLFFSLTLLGTAHICHAGFWSNLGKAFLGVPTYNYEVIAPTPAPQPTAPAVKAAPVPKPVVPTPVAPVAATQPVKK